MNNISKFAALLLLAAVAVVGLFLPVGTLGENPAVGALPTYQIYQVLSPKGYGIVTSNGIATSTLTATPNPSVTTITATSTTATSTFSGGFLAKGISAWSFLDAPFINATSTKASTLPYASSTSVTISGTPYITTHKGFSYATSTWSATTTLFLEVAYGETWNSVVCATDAGTLNVDTYHASSHLNLLNASTTKGTFTFSTNNTTTNGDLVKVDVGTPASSPTKIVCTYNMNTQ